jgi:hypothetical protein
MSQSPYFKTRILEAPRQKATKSQVTNTWNNNNGMQSGVTKCCNSFQVTIPHTMQITAARFKRFSQNCEKRLLASCLSIHLSERNN